MAWMVDPAHTSVEFTAKHMMFTKVRGRFDKFSGTLNLDEQHPENSSVEGSIDVASIDTREPNRDAHLRSADFFDAEKYPTITFRSTRVEVTGVDRAKVYGDLTIKDVTRPIVLDAAVEGRGKDPWGNERWGLSARATVSRKDWGLTWNVALETGGWLVGDTINIEIEAEVVKQQPAPAEEPAASAAS